MVEFDDWSALGSADRCEQNGNEKAKKSDSHGGQFDIFGGTLSIGTAKAFVESGQMRSVPTNVAPVGGLQFFEAGFGFFAFAAGFDGEGDGAAGMDAIGRTKTMKVMAQSEMRTNSSWSAKAAFI